MKIRAILLTVCLMFVLSAFCFAFDLKWKSPIGIDPVTPTQGDTITFNCKLKSAGGASDNVKVIGKIDGSQVWEKTYTHFNTNQAEWINFTWTGVAGGHTVGFVIDPDKTTGDANSLNNARSVDFSVKAIVGTSVEWDMSSFSMTPASPKAGEQITFSMKLKVKNGSVDNLKVIMGINGQTWSTGNYPHLNAGQSSTVDFKWYSSVGSHTVFFTLDPDQTTTDENFNDNNFTKVFTPKDIGTDIYWKGFSYKMEPASPKYGDEILFRCGIQVDAKPVDNLLVVGAIDGNKIKERTFPSLGISTGPSFAMGWRAWSGGTHTMVFTIDPKHTTDDQDFADNTLEKIFTVEPPPPGAMPNIKFANIKVTPVKANYKAGDKITVTFTITNDGNLISQVIPVKVYFDNHSFINYLGLAAYLKPGESKSASFSRTVKCGKYKIIIDPQNKIAESNENDNKWEMKTCSIRIRKVIKPVLRKIN